MKEGKPNQFGGPCVHCGRWVAEGKGRVERVETDSGYTWRAAHIGACPTEAAKPTAVEVPRWAVYGHGRTPLGNEAYGVRLIDSVTRPDGGIPVNDAARAMEGA